MIISLYLNPGSVFGKTIYAIGGNYETAQLAGINV